MRNTRWNVPAVALPFLFALALSGVAEAQKVTVIRGSDVSVVDASARGLQKQTEDAARRAREQESSASAEPEEEPTSAKRPTRRKRVLIVDAEADPDLAWKLISPWETRTEVREGGSSQIRTHSGREASSVRNHGIGGERSNPSVIPVAPYGGDESRIRTHGVGSR